MKYTFLSVVNIFFFMADWRILLLLACNNSKVEKNEFIITLFLVLRASHGYFYTCFIIVCTNCFCSIFPYVPLTNQPFFFLFTDTSLKFELIINFSKYWRIIFYYFYYTNTQFKFMLVNHNINNTQIYKLYELHNIYIFISTNIVICFYKNQNK